MGAVGLAGTICCFIFGGIFLLITFLSWSFSTLFNTDQVSTIILGGIGCALLVCGWWIGSMTNNNDVN